MSSSQSAVQDRRNVVLYTPIPGMEVECIRWSDSIVQSDVSEFILGVGEVSPDEMMLAVSYDFEVGDRLSILFGIGIGSSMVHLEGTIRTCFEMAGVFWIGLQFFNPLSGHLMARIERVLQPGT